MAHGTDAHQPDARQSGSYGAGDPPWVRRLRALYDVKFLDWQEWRDILGKQGYSDEVLVAAVDWMAEQGLPEPRTVGALRAAVAAMREEAKRASGAVTVYECPLCHGKGVVTCYPETDFRADRFTRGVDPLESIIMETMFGYQASVVCTCRTGERLATEAKYYKGMDAVQKGRLNATRQWAKTQVEWLNARMAEWSRRYPHGSRQPAPRLSLRRAE